MPAAELSLSPRFSAEENAVPQLTEEVDGAARNGLSHQSASRGAINLAGTSER